MPPLTILVVTGGNLHFFWRNFVFFEVSSSPIYADVSVIWSNGYSYTQWTFHPFEVPPKVWWIRRNHLCATTATQCFRSKREFKKHIYRTNIEFWCMKFQNVIHKFEFFDVSLSTYLCWRHLNMVQWVEFHTKNISSIGSTTKSMMDLKKPPACHICDTMCRTQNCIVKSILEGH